MNEQAFNIKLVQEVQKHPCLYNYELPQYSRKDIKDAAWNEVGKEVNMSGAACKDKWKNLRAVFVRDMKAPPSGSGAKKKKYYLAEVMQFIYPYVKALNSRISENLPDDNNYNIIPKLEVEAEYSNGSLPTEPEVEVTVQPTTEIDSLQLNTSELSCITDCKCKKQYLKEADKTLINFLKESQLACNENKADTRKMFLLSLLDEVNTMSEEQMRVFKRRVLTLIDDIMSPITTITMQASQPQHNLQSYSPISQSPTQTSSQDNN